MPRPDKKQFDMPQGVGDDLYMNDGQSFADEYFDLPEDRKEAEQQAAAEKVASAPALQAIEEWFKEQIANCDNFDNIRTREAEINGIKISTTVSIEGQVYAYQLLKQLLTDKHEEYRQFAKELE